MSSDNNNDDNVHIQVRPAVFYTMIAAIFAGNAAITGYATKGDNVRPDPFTGAQGRALEARMEKIEQRDQYHIDVTHRALDGEIKALERELAGCLRHLQGHETTGRQ